MSNMNYKLDLLLKSLRLPVMLKMFEEKAEEGLSKGWSYQEYLSVLIELEFI